MLFVKYERVLVFENSKSKRVVLKFMNQFRFSLHQYGIKCHQIVRGGIVLIRIITLHEIQKSLEIYHTIKHRV